MGAREALRDPENFIRGNTVLTAPPLVPELRLHVAAEMLPIWQMTEEEMQQAGLPPPFWAFAWAGGQALARYILDHPEHVAGKNVLDFGAGSGIVGIAAAQAGAARVCAAEIDPVALVAIALNAQANNVELTCLEGDLTGEPGGAWEVVLAGDVCYEGPASRRIMGWLTDLNRSGALVLVGDPGRTYFPKTGMEKLISYAVKTTTELEDTDLRNTSVWRLMS
ncbi:MAG: class I SAM-dependent methyltransferase [Pseudomonadota bacterium]|jgi:predicted nicotinamide N-methyase|nr:nicotinamide N-methylase [Alphaproteobacteria bacterium]